MNAEFLSHNYPILLICRGMEHSSKQSELAHLGVISMRYAGKIFLSTSNVFDSLSLADI